MRNILLGGVLLLGTASFLMAQQVTAGSVNSVSPVYAVAPTGSTLSYAYADKEFKEGDMKSKEVSKEITSPKGADIYIENLSRSIVVKTWDQQKVKVTTTVYYDAESGLTDEEWLGKINLSLKILGSSVKIKSGSIGNGGFDFSNNGPATFLSENRNANVTLFNSNGQNVGSGNNVKRAVTITVPAGSKLDIESKYSDVTLPANVGGVTVDITNGNLEADNLSRFILRSKYASINVGDVKSAEVEITNGRFSAKNIDDLDIESKYSTVEIAAAKKMVLRSTNDEYEMEEAGEVRGRKSYGNLRITKLNGSLEMDGSNADVKIRNVGPSVSLIKLDDKYADVRIPLRDTKSYSVDFTGSYSSVYGNFEKKEVLNAAQKYDEKMAAPGSEAPVAAGTPVRIRITGMQVRTPGWSDIDNGPSHFTATVGDGKGLKIDMKCRNCTVDFK